MIKNSSLFSSGLVGKMMRAMVTFVLAMGVIFSAIFGYHLSGLHNMTISEEEEQLQLLTERSGKSVTYITEENLKSLVLSASERADDEFRIVKQDLISLRSQVEDVFRHPENYKPRKISPPKKETGSEPALQLLAPNGYENISAETYGMMERLANLEPMMKEIVCSDDYTIDCYICTLDGVTLDYDRLSEGKFDENGNIKDFDARKRGWFDDALKAGDVCFSSTTKGALYGFHELLYSAPVYAHGKPVAVVEGCLRMQGMTKFMEDRAIGKSGFAVLIGKDGQLAASPREDGELKLGDDVTEDVRNTVNPELKALINKGLSGQTGVERVHVDGGEYYAAYGYIPVPGWTQILFESVDEVMVPAEGLISEMEEYSDSLINKEKVTFNISVIIVALAIVLIMIVSNVYVSRRIKKKIAPIVQMTDSLKEFSGINMFFEMEDEYKTGDEVQVLAENFESLAGKMRDYVDKIVDEMSEKERVRTELSLATKIQADMLPNIFPAFPERPEFTIYASMTPAKEVGGDFYDFFFAGDTHLAMVMADVSGKGVPAAMFMMMAKSMIQSRIIAKRDPKSVLEEVNNLICENNKEKMFVTVWVGILDINTGIVTAANAGHEYPILKDVDGNFRIIKDKHGFVIGGKKNMKHTNYEMLMEPGAKLFVYTDGVPEAMNEAGELFGMERTLAAVNLAAESAPEDILATVDSEVKKFVESAEQFDDLTMLCIEYKGPKPLSKEITVDAIVENLDMVQDFVNEELVIMNCPKNIKGQINVAIDELFGNIAHYAYDGETGDATVRVETIPDRTEITITLIDSGKPFNPLNAQKPDVTLSASQRVRGGLGIYLVKKTMDDVIYKYEDGKNHLSIRKILKKY